MTSARWILLALTLGAQLGCYVPVVRVGPPMCRFGSYWVYGFRDGWGYFHPGHWQCR